MNWPSIRWRAVAIKDFQDAVRSKSLLIVTTLLVVFIAGAAFVFGELFDDGGSTATLGLSLAAPSAFLVPILALLVSYRSIAGERETGSIRFVLGLPHSRADVLVGKWLGRSAVVAVAILVGFSAGAVVALVTYELDPVGFVGFTLLTLLLGLVYVAIGTGLSACTDSGAKAGILVLSVFVLFEYLWGLIGLLFLYVLGGFDPSFATAPGWYEWFTAISPSASYQYAMFELVPGGASAAMAEPGGEVAMGALPVWVPFVVLGGWITLFLALGYWRFERADLT
ncbi:ABC transporter permease [Halovivax gelatinilyticus]|uniref:ABC transporter permease n=1 Tax=Halovivax gelatinilyticus TaxID=2961597 RepID=UPI0020CA352B|nr:ABC transporter permease [Halovivax gelatinilyticus]